MKEIVERLTENRQIELAKSILESNGYKVEKKVNESDSYSYYSKLISREAYDKWREMIDAGFTDKFSKSTGDVMYSAYRYLNNGNTPGRSYKVSTLGPRLEDAINREYRRFKKSISES